MIIRLLTQKDVAEHDKITSQAFSYACEIGDPDSVLPCEKVLGAFDDDNKTLFADLELQERTCNYDGGFLTCAAVGGVAAKPEHRGKGAVKALFEHVFRESGCDVSVLYPFSEAYYRKLGYERAGRSVSAAVPFSELAGIERNHDATLYEGNDTQQLLEIYNRCEKSHNLSFVRENAQAFSSEPYASMRYTYIWKNRSFATICVDREKSAVLVDELCFDSRESMLGIVGFLRNFESNQKTVCFQKLPEDTPLLRYVRDLKNCGITLHNTGSVRILNVENVLRAHRYPAAGAFTLRVCDETFRVECSESGVEVGKTDLQEPDVILDVNAASQILLCGLSDAQYMPGIVIRNPDLDFLKLFPPRTAFFTDAF